MNPGIRGPNTKFASMPRGLLGRPTPVPLPGASRVFDRDAETYIATVETADRAPLEEPVRIAIGEFVIGCKEDGLWPLLKSSCILCGAKTLSGALVPLVGGTITNLNFVSADYNRRTGLLGNGTNKWLRTSLLANQLNSLSHHALVGGPLLTTAVNGGVAVGTYNGSAVSSLFDLNIGTNTGGRELRSGTGSGSSGIQISASAVTASGTVCGTRTSAADLRLAQNGITAGAAVTPATPAFAATAWGIFARNDNGTGIYFNASRLNFFSIGDGLSVSAVAALHARVTVLQNAILGF